MYDCEYVNIGHVHMHINPERGRASVISDYQKSNSSDHSSDLKSGRESEAKLLTPAGITKYYLELFLSNDDFGQLATEKVEIYIENDGKSFIQASRPDGSRRLLSKGSCLAGLPK